MPVLKKKSDPQNKMKVNNNNKGKSIQCPQPSFTYSMKHSLPHFPNGTKMTKLIGCSLEVCHGNLSVLLSTNTLPRKDKTEKN